VLTVNMSGFATTKSSPIKLNVGAVVQVNLALAVAASQETVTVNGTSTRLHFIWDSVCWEYNQELDRPLSSKSLEVVENFATYLTSTYTFTDDQKKEYNSTKFALESFADAVSTAYPGTYNGMTIDAAYLARCKPVAEARVAIAGYRLASELNYIFPSSSSSSSGSSASGHSEAERAVLAKKIRDRLIRSHVDARNVMFTQKEQLRAQLKSAKKH